MATPIAHKGVTAGAKVLAMTMVDLLTKPALVEQAWDYFRERPDQGHEVSAAHLRRGQAGDLAEQEDHGRVPRADAEVLLSPLGIRHLSRSAGHRLPERAPPRRRRPRASVSRRRAGGKRAVSASTFLRHAAGEAVDVDDPAAMQAAGDGLVAVVGLDLERDDGAVDVDHPRPADDGEPLGHRGQVLDLDDRCRRSARAAPGRARSPPGRRIRGGRPARGSPARPASGRRRTRSGCSRRPAPATPRSSPSADEKSSNGSRGCLPDHVFRPVSSFRAGSSLTRAARKR